jgi:hypothetical protein
MKFRIRLFKSYFAKVTTHQLLPMVCYSKNVQGYKFISNISFYCLTYCINFALIRICNTDKDRITAHEMNVKRFIKSNTLKPIL